MKGSRITAVGLVAAAALWIASGHFLPHESAESRAAIRPSENEAKKLFRVAVMQTNVVQHSRKLTISGRTEADKRVMRHGAHRRRADRAAGQARHLPSRKATSSPCCPTRRATRRSRRRSRW